jgi:26S proteasome regulatory subunit N5
MQTETNPVYQSQLSQENEAALEKLFEAERESRQSNNLDLSIKTVTQIMQIILATRDPARIVHIAKNLTAKRGQMIKSTSQIVRDCMSFIDQIGDIATKINFVEALKTMCEKKIYLEVEYARCAMMLVKFKEGTENDLQAAAKIMENVQVETYGSMTKKEKMEFILYQMRIQFLLKDRTKLYIVAKKVNTKTLDEEGFHLLKISYFLYFFHIHLKAKEFDGCASCLEKVHQGFGKLKDLSELKELDLVIQNNFSTFLDKNVLAESIIVFKCLQEHSLTKIDELDVLRGKFEAYLIKNRKVLELADSFLSKEITTCDVDYYEARKQAIFSSNFPNHSELLMTLHKQLVKKNLIIISRYFRNSRMQKIAELLDTNYDIAEENLCELILVKIVRGKIDRPSKMIEFLKESTDVEVVDNWVKNINEIVDIIDFACERIEREEIKAR